MKKAKKWILRILLFFIVAYVVAILLSGYMMNKTTSVTYNTTCAVITLRSYSIDFQTHTAQRSYYDFWGDFESKEERTINDSDIFRIKTICTFSLLPLWRKSYVNPFVMDGDQWNLIRKHGTIKNETFGSNAYPLSYKFVFSCISTVFDKKGE